MLALNRGHDAVVEERVPPRAFCEVLSLCPRSVQVRAQHRTALVNLVEYLPVCPPEMMPTLVIHAEFVREATLGIPRNDPREIRPRLGC